MEEYVVSVLVEENRYYRVMAESVEDVDRKFDLVLDKEELENYGYVTGDCEIVKILYKQLRAVDSDYDIALSAARHMTDYTEPDAIE